MLKFFLRAFLGLTSYFSSIGNSCCTYVFLSKIKYLPLQDVNLFQTCQVDKMLEINMICVCPEETGQGLAFQMIEWSEKEAKNCGIKAMTGETTNVASSKVFQKAKTLGKGVIHERRWSFLTSKVDQTQSK